MGNDNKLGVVGHGAHVVGKAHHVAVVQGRLDLVHHHEGGRPHLQNGKVQGDGHKGLLAAGQQRDDLQRLAGGLHLDLNAAVEDVVGVLQLQGGLAASKQLHKGLSKRLIDAVKLPGKDSPHLPGDLGDHVLQLLLGLFHIIPLVGKVSVPLIDPVKLLNGAHIYIAQGGDALFQLSNAPAGLGH